MMQESNGPSELYGVVTIGASAGGVAALPHLVVQETAELARR